MDCVKLGIETRKQLLKRCSQLKPFIPQQVAGKDWQDHDTDLIANDARFFTFVPGKRGTASKAAQDQYLVDPCKLLLTTPGIDAATGQYTEFGVPATILANFLRENGIVPEKCDPTRSCSC